MNYFIFIRKLAFFQNKNNNFANYNNADRYKWQKIAENPISTEQSNNKNNNNFTQQHGSKLAKDFITKLCSNQIEYQQKQQEREKQQQQQRQLYMEPIAAAIVKNLHDDKSPFVQHNHQYQHSDDQNHKKNNNDNNNISDDYVVDNGLLIDVNDDDGVDYSRHSYDNYYNSKQEEELKLEGSSNKLLVTFDYGFSDSIEQQQQQQLSYECDYHKNEQQDDDSQMWMICNPHQIKADAAQFPVHRMRHNIKDNEMSFLSTLIEYDVDDESEEMLHYTPLAGSKIKLFKHNYGLHYYNDDNFANKREVRIEADEVGDDDEEEFYDSLEATRA